MDNGIDGCIGDAVFARQIRANFTCRVSLTNVANSIFGQFCIEVTCAEMWSAFCASLAGTILHIVGLCPQKQMIGIDTARIVTRMADEHAIGNWSVIQFVGETMRSVKSLS